MALTRCGSVAYRRLREPLRLRLERRDPEDRPDPDERPDREELRERDEPVERRELDDFLELNDFFALDDFDDRPDAFLPVPRRFRVAAAFRADAERAALDRRAEAAPPFRPPFLEDVRVLFLPRPDPLFLPPLSSLFTVAQARRSDSLRDTPRSSYPSSMCSALRFCLSV